MEQLKLIFPTLQMEQEALDYKLEFMNHGETVIHGSGLIERIDTYNEWLKKITDETTRDDGTYVPATTYFAVIGDKIVGTIQVRHKLNDALLKRSGHIGYAVRPSERLKGYASQMLAIAIDKCCALGIEKALVTCDKDNIGSARTIIKKGGVLENEVAQEDGIMTQRYWIDVSGGTK